MQQFGLLIVVFSRLRVAMYYLHVSNRTENLLQHLSELIRVDKQSFFNRELFLIQSQGMERMIGQFLAEKFCSFCNFGFFLPLDFLEFIAGKLDLQILSDGYRRHILVWRLDGLLRDISDDCYGDIRQYLSGENVNLKRFQLARQLANIFDQYQIMRADMLAAWEDGKCVVNHPAEVWQMDLWQRLTALLKGSVHRGGQMQKLITLLNDSQGLSSLLPKRISIIGLHIMPPIYLEFLNSLANHMDVHLFILSPCRYYWGDLAEKRERIRFETSLRRQDSLPDPEDEVYHPLLALLGRQGRDFQKMLLENVIFQMEFESFVDPLDPPSQVPVTLLNQLQSDLLNGLMHQGKTVFDFRDDNSIQVVACHSKLRELGVLKDYILGLLHGDADLALRDIVVMAPDIQEYAPLIPALFADIQYSIADRSVQRNNRIINTFLTFLHLFKGRFGWSELLELLAQPEVYPNFQLTASDVDILRSWIVKVGIRWGLSPEQRGDSGLPPFAETSWRAGLDRLLMGCFIDSEECVDGLFPFTEIEGRGAEPLGGLCRYLELIERGYQDFKKGYSLLEWSEILLAYIRELFGGGDDQNLLSLRAMVIDLGESDNGFDDHPIDFAVICEWFSHIGQERRSSSGFLRGQLTFCSMLPMRSIPFKVICILGLNDTVFPKADNHATFDIMGFTFRRGDRLPRADDRYQFLEAILAARSHLYLSFIGRSIKTNEKIEPSLVITEFLEVLADNYGVDDMVVYHPLHPFNHRYFCRAEENSLFSYNDYYCRTAAMLQKGPVSPSPWWRGRVERGVENVFFADLVSFFKNPQRWFVRKVLGIGLDGLENFPREREVFQAVGLGKYYIEQDLIAWELGGRHGDLLHRLQEEGLWPLGAPGRIGFEKKREEIAPFIKGIRDQEMGDRLSDRPFNICVGKFLLDGLLTNIYENGVLLFHHGKLRGSDLLTAWLHHLVHTRLASTALTSLVTDEGTFLFRGSASREPNLEKMISHFVLGTCEPSTFFVEPAFQYVKQLGNSRARLSPMSKAVDTLRKKLELGYEPEWVLLYGNCNDVSTLLTTDFESHCRDIMAVIWSNGNEG